MAKLKILNRYATIPNDLLNNDSISLKAKGMYAFIQSKPDDWDFSAERISKQLKEGMPSVKSALQELEANGYLLRKRFHNSKGFWEIEYLLFENPEVGKPLAENQVLGNPPADKPTSGKPSNISNQDYSNKDYNKTIIKTNRDLIFDKWFGYKKEKKQTYTESGKNALFEKWKNKSDIELEKAVENSMSNNWSGLIEPKENNNGNEPKLGTSAARMEALRKW